MTSNRTIEFRSLEIDDEFLFPEHVYRKCDQQWAMLLRLASGVTPPEKTVHHFYGDNVVEVFDKPHER